MTDEWKYILKADKLDRIKAAIKSIGNIAGKMLFIGFLIISAPVTQPHLYQLYKIGKEEEKQAIEAAKNASPEQIKEMEDIVSGYNLDSKE